VRLALCLLFLLIASWLGVRAAVVTALVLLMVIAAACWSFFWASCVGPDPFSSLYKSFAGTRVPRLT
jgi:hypothetical protein